MKVFVYFNLRKKVWSIKALEGPNKNKVIAHAKHVSLENCTFKVSQKGRERVLREKQKNVHAGVQGEMIHMSENSSPKALSGNSATYNPYKFKSFVNSKTETPVFNSPKVEMNVKERGVEVLYQK